MLIAVPISSVVLLLFFTVYSYSRYRLFQRRSRQLADWRRLSRLLFSNRVEPSPSRLDQNVIDTIPVTQFSLHGDKATESCAVCISEFIEGEKVRVLPQCRHLFHLECIDMWFMSHSTCPLCRADVKSAATSENKELDGITENKEVLHAHSDEEVVHYPETNNYSRDGRVHQSPLDMV